MNVMGKSETGRRPHNEDAFLIYAENGKSFVALSDGMGGHAAGETASRISIETVQSFLSEASNPDEGTLQQAFLHANQAVWEAAASDEHMYGMGATLVAAILKSEECYAANVGDSRLYHYHDGRIRQISHDHSFVAELIRRNIITPEEAKTHPRRNLITRAIGTEEKLRVDLFSFAWEKGDILLLCSDGLSGVLDDSELAEILSSAENMDTACNRLIERAYASGSSDNITVVLAQNSEAHV